MSDITFVNRKMAFDLGKNAREVLKAAKSRSKGHHQLARVSMVTSALWCEAFLRGAIADDGKEADDNEVYVDIALTLESIYFALTVTVVNELTKTDSEKITGIANAIDLIRECETDIAKVNLLLKWDCV